ncbi:MAG: flagellin [Gemmatimonadetes bacterium]|nr:flagellin [Gemmatimonadota bacterium]
MRINTNVPALQAARNLGNVNKALASSTEKLSSGFRINKASDDAAGLGIANVLRSDIRAYNQASRNAEQANSVYAIAEGAASAIQNMLERMKELSAQAASDSVDSAGRSRINAEFTALQSEISRTVDTTKFQGQTLLNGGFGATVNSSSTALSTATAGVYDVQLSGAAAGSYTLSAAAGVATLSNGSVNQTLAVTSGANQSLNFSQFGITVRTNTSVNDGTLNGMNVTVGGGSGTFLVGASGAYTTNDVISISGSSLDLTTSTLGVNASTVDTRANAATALSAIDTAIGKVNTALGVIGAGQSRIDNAISNLKTTVQNFAAAESTIRDVDMAEEMTKFSKNQILSQAGVAMLAQANQSGQGVLRLLS